MQIGDLRACAHRRLRRSTERIPQADTLVCCASTRSQDATLMRRPSESFNSSFMLAKSPLGGLAGSSVPYANTAFVSSRGKLLLVRRPLQTTNLLAVTFQARHEVLRRLPHVALQDCAILTASGERFPTPRKGTDPLSVTCHRSHFAPAGGIPNLNIASLCAYNDLVAIRTPFHGSNAVFVPEVA